MSNDNKDDDTRGLDWAAREKIITGSRSWFLGIGINTYNPPFTHLQNAQKDVSDIAQLLRDRYELDEELILLGEEATRNAIIDHFQMLDEQVGKDDKLIIYYAGHGHLDKKERGYWIPADAQENRVATYILNANIKAFISGIEAKHILLISDSCFSGALLSREGHAHAALEELDQDRSRWVISSGRQREKVADGIPGKNSPFAGSIIKVLRNNQDARLNTGLLFDQVMKLTRFNYKQLPQSAPLFGVGHEGGQYIFRLQTSEDSMWEEAEKMQSIQAYNQYLDTFPYGQYSDEALVRIQSLKGDQEWEKVRKIDKVYAYRKYLKNFPASRHENTAKARIVEIENEINQQSILTSKYVPTQQPVELLNELVKKVKFKKKDLLEAITNRIRVRKWKVAIFLLAIIWAIGSVFVWTGLNSLISLLISGFSAGAIIKWVYAEIKWEQVLVATLGWLIGGFFSSYVTFNYIGFTEVSRSAASIVIMWAGIHAIWGVPVGFATGVIMKWAYAEIKWEQVRFTTYGWAIGWAIGGLSKGVFFSLSSGEDPFEIGCAIAGAIEGAISGGVTFLQYRKLRNE